MTNTTDMQRALQSFHQEWEEFLAVFQNLSEEEYLLPGAVGYWSVREALLHVAAWDVELVVIVDKYRRTGEKSDYGTDEEVDELNEDQVQEKHDFSMEQVWKHLHDSHQQLADFLTGLPEEAFDPKSYSGDWIATDSFGHYVEHRENIERWKASR